MITLIGMGTEKGDLSLRALCAMKKATTVLLRSASPVSEGLTEAGIAFETLDFLYEKSRSFDTLTKNIVKEVRVRAAHGDVCYCVEGALTEDRAAQILQKGRDVAVIEGVGKAAKAASRAGLCGAYTALSAYELPEAKTALPLVVYDITDQTIASDVKLTLAERYGDEAPALYIDGGTQKNIPLYEADRQENYTAGTALVVFDTLLLKRKRFNLDDLLAILRLLRAPDGCPWDRVQTHESIRINAIEEAYELVDAIDKGDPDKMCEEAGDVIMQSAFHTVMEEEQGNFTMTDVLSELCLKLITRHTHVFGGDRAQNAESALSVWDKNKMTEKGQKTYSDAVNDVPGCFPALLRAQKVSKRMEKGGWDKPTLETFDEAFASEYNELLVAVKSGDEKAIAGEMGDVLMCVVDLGRAVGVECEQALLDTVKKLQARYTAYEALVRADGKDVHALSKEERDEYYKRAKDASRA